MSKRNLFEKRVEAKPYEYPELIDFKDAIRHSYWLSSEFNYTSDIQDYHVNVTPAEKSVLTKAMLAIAQVEVSVKRFWSDLYKYFPKPEIDLVGVTFGECHIEGTEILTPSGWKDFRDIEVGDLVCQFNPEDKTSEFVPATRVIKAPYNGPMYRFRKRKWECVVTPNHRMLDYDRNGNIRVREARNFWSDSSGTKPFTSYKRGFVNELSDMDRLKIAIQADGHHLYSTNKRTGERVYRVTPDGCYIYSIKLAKERKIERLFKILEYTGVPFRHHVDKHNHHIFDIYTPKENYKNFDWVDLTDKSCWWCNEFIEELSHWDGYRIEGKKDCWIKYSSTNKSCADKVQAIGSLAGYWATMNTYVDPRSERYRDIHTVSFINNRDSVHHNHDTDVFQYSGMVYCCTVPSGFIITRYKDTISIEGNSECHIEGTEILTPSGWVNFKDITWDRLVCQFDARTKEISFAKPTKVIKNRYQGELYRFSTENDKWVTVVTPNHRMLDFDPATGEERVVLAKDFDVSVDRVKYYGGYDRKSDNEIDNITLYSLDNPNIQKEVIDYDGMIYCVTVPSGFIITRYGGTVSIEGNCRHFDAYSDLLEKLGMNDMFSNIREYPALMGRVEYIENFLSNKELSKSHFILSLIMFSLFVEHISLFGQFLVIMSFNKHKNMFKGISNAIEATSKEEEIHGRFGIALYGILKEEHPELFTEEFYQELTALADSALKAEKAILHWIFEEGDLDFIDLATAENYIIHRYNNSLEILGIEAPYLVDEKLLDKTRWFDEEVLSGKENDFFYKRSTDYSKKQKQITADDLF